MGGVSWFYDRHNALCSRAQEKCESPSETPKDANGIHWNPLKNVQIEFSKTFDCIQRSQMIARALSESCEGLFFLRGGVSWLSWHGNSILNGQNGPNGK